MITNEVIMTFKHQTLSQIAISLPGATKIFREYNLDFCCGGSVLLEVAANAKNLDLAEIEKRLTQLTEEKQEVETDWNTASYEQVIEYLLERFHKRHREQLPELILLAQRVEQVHGDREDCPMGVSAQLEAILADLESHMMKEEQILFPMIKSGHYAMARMPIQVMEMEHDNAGQDLEVLKSLTNNVVPPENACFTWRSLYTGINQFIDDLMHHVHIENNVLFQRVLREQ